MVTMSHHTDGVASSRIPDQRPWRTSFAVAQHVQCSSHTGKSAFRGKNSPCCVTDGFFVDNGGMAITIEARNGYLLDASSPEMLSYVANPGYSPLAKERRDTG